jgi:hypothetical protein
VQKRLPRGLNATKITEFECAFTLYNIAPIGIELTAAVKSFQPLTNYSRAGSTASEST